MAAKDWSNEQSIDEFAFAAKNVIIRYIPRLKIWLSGIHGRSSFKNEFMLKNGIKKNAKASGAIMPKYYNVSHKRNDYIANIRDSIIMSKYAKYSKTQKILTEAIRSLNDDIRVAEKNLGTQKEVLDDQKRSLTAAKRSGNSMNIISYQAAIESQKTSIKASGRRIEIMRENLEGLKAQEKKNKEQWLKQIDYVESKINNLAASFENNITKKVKNTFEFSNFELHIKEYSASIKQILNGEEY